MKLLVLSVLLVAWSEVTCYLVRRGSPDTFNYFAYGSNLLKNRIHIHNPSAVMNGIARLDNYRLDFNLTVAAWRGAVATVVPDPGRHVWGTLWTLNITDIANLDRQEGVDLGWYFAANETVISPTRGRVNARVYIETHNPPRTKILPIGRRPSITYLETIILGAFQSKLPQNYIKYLFTFPMNGKFATKKMREELGYPFNTI